MERALQQLLHALLFFVTAAVANVAEEQSGAECRKKLEWFERLNKDGTDPPLPGMIKEDPLFPAGLSSVGQDHSDNCGDSSTGKTEPCTKFNHWGTFQEVAANDGKGFAVIGKAGIYYSDVNQGQLGDCYFLSALASIAHARPELIDEMLVQRELWGEMIYTSRWLVGGEDILVAVNNDIPIDSTFKNTFFAHPAEHDGAYVFWPLILEKAWSKMARSFEAVEGGVWMNVVAGITSAPVKTLRHSKVGKERVWARLTDATLRSFPMGAGTSDRASDFHMPESHAYAILEAKRADSGDRVVTVYNPWGHDKYKGQVANENHDDGIFTLTFDEFLHAFEDTQIAEVENGYHTARSQLRSDSELILGVREFEVTEPGAVFVSVSWLPDHLMEPCSVSDPDVVIVVAKRDSMDKITVGDNAGTDYGVNSASATVRSGPGRYVAYAAAKFRRHYYIRSVTLSIYAPERVAIAQSDLSPSTATQQMLEPDCTDGTMTMSSKQEFWNGVFVRNPRSRHLGISSYEAFDGQAVAYFNPGCGGWTFIGKSQWDEVLQGASFNTPCYTASELGRCGTYDSKLIGGFGITCRSIENRKYKSLKCKGVRKAKTIQRYCPETCKSISQEADMLGNHPELVSPKCDVISVLGKGRWHDGLYTKHSEALHGVPTYLSWDGETVAYYKRRCKGWTFIGIKQWPHVQAGSSYLTPCYPASVLGQCGCHDAAKIGPFGNVDCGTVAAKKYSNIACTGVGQHHSIQRYCPKTCWPQACSAGPIRLFSNGTRPVQTDRFDRKDVSLYGFSGLLLGALGWAAMAQVARRDSRQLHRDLELIPLE